MDTSSYHYNCYPTNGKTVFTMRRAPAVQSMDKYLDPKQHRAISCNIITHSYIPAYGLQAHRTPSRYEDRLHQYRDSHYIKEMVVTPSHPLLRRPWSSFIDIHLIILLIGFSEMLTLTVRPFPLKPWLITPQHKTLGFIEYIAPVKTEMGSTWSDFSSIGLLPDTYSCGLRVRRECQKRFHRHRGLAIRTYITAHACRTCRDACRDR